MNAILADNKCVWCSDEKLDEALCHQTPGHAMWDLEEEGLIGKGAAEQLLSEVPDGWFNLLLEVESRLIVERRTHANTRFHERKCARENVELVNALEQIHEALVRGVPSAAEKLAYDALAKWGRG